MLCQHDTERGLRKLFSSGFTDKSGLHTSANSLQSYTAFRPSATDANTIAWDTCITALDHFGLFASFALDAQGGKKDIFDRSFLNRYFSTCSLSTSIMADITTVAALYLLYKSQKCWKTTRRHVWVHKVLRRHTELGEFHCPLQDLCPDDDWFQRYLRLTRAQFEDLLARVSAHTQLQLASPPCWSECKQPYVRGGISSAWTHRWLDVAVRCRLKISIFSTLFVSLQTLQTCHFRCSRRPRRFKRFRHFRRFIFTALDTPFTPPPPESCVIAPFTLIFRCVDLLLNLHLSPSVWTPLNNLESSVAF